MELKLSSFEELESYLKNWTTYHKDERNYDVVGITVLLNACIENLRINKDYFDLNEISGIITEENLNFLKTIKDISNK